MSTTIFLLLVLQMQRLGYSISSRGGPQITHEYIINYLEKRNDTHEDSEEMSHVGSLIEEEEGQTVFETVEYSEPSEVLQYDEPSNTYFTSSSCLGDAIEQLGVTLGCLLVLDEDYIPGPRYRIYRCYFAKHKLSAAGSRKIHTDMLKRAASYQRSSSTLIGCNRSETHFRNARAEDLANGENDNYLREPRHLSRLHLKCQVRVRVELPLMRAGNVRLQVIADQHGHPVGDYINSQPGCLQQYSLRGHTGVILLKVRPVLKKAFSLYRQANKSASYGELAKLSISR